MSIGKIFKIAFVNNEDLIEDLVVNQLNLTLMAESILEINSYRR